MGQLSELLSTRVKENEVVVKGMSGEAIESFQERASRSVASENETLFTFEKEEDAQALIRKALEENAQVISMTPRKESLEEYFVRQVSDQQNSA